MRGQVDVTVMIAAWRAESFIGDAIASALAQSDVSLEVIVVDDCSPDDTFGAALKAADGDERLKVVRMDKNGGPSAARNKAIDLANGRYVAVLDADDRMAPGRLANLVAAGDDTGADIVVDNIVRVSPKGERIDSAPFLTGSVYSKRHEIDLNAYVAGNVFMSGGQALGYLKPLFRTETLNRFELRYDQALRNSEDYYLVADLLAFGARMVFEPFEGYLYRVDAGSISHRLKPELTQALTHAEQDFQDRHRERLTPDQAEALKHRIERLRHAHAYVVFIQRMKERHLIGAVGVVAARPTSWGFVARQLGEIVQQRLSA